MLARRITTAKRVPEKIQTYFKNLSQPESADETMFREVVARAILDAVGLTGISEANEHNAVVRDARGWFKTSEDVSYIFNLSGIDEDPKVIGEALLKVKVKHKKE